MSEVVVEAVKKSWQPMKKASTTTLVTPNISTSGEDRGHSNEVKLMHYSHEDGERRCFEKVQTKGGNDHYDEGYDVGDEQKGDGDDVFNQNLKVLKFVGLNDDETAKLFKSIDEEDLRGNDTTVV